MNHDYTSTACQRGMHEECRKTSKFGQVPCKCDCHNPDYCVKCGGVCERPKEHGGTPMRSDERCQCKCGVLFAAEGSEEAAIVEREQAQGRGKQ